MAMASTWAELLARKWILRAKDWGTCPNVGELMLPRALQFPNRVPDAGTNPALRPGSGSTVMCLKFQIRYAHPISLDFHQLYIVIVANACAYTQGLSWLLGAIKLKL